MKLYPITIPGGSDTQIQYNNGGIFGGSAHAVLNDATGVSTFTGVMITDCAVLGSDSAVFQPNADSTTFFQVNQADGTNFFNLDSTNRIVGVNSTATTSQMEINVLSQKPALSLTGVNFYNGTALGGTGFGFLCYYNTANNKQFLIADNDKLASSTVPSIKISFTPTTIYLQSLTTVGANMKTFTINNALTVGPITKVGINEKDPATMLEMTGVAPYITTHNSTHNDGDATRLSRWIGKGEKGIDPFTEGTLGIAEWGHDGTGDDFKGYFKISTNANGGADTVVDALLVQNTGNWVINKTSGVGIKVDLAAPTFGFADIIGDQFSKNTGATKPTLTAYNGAIDGWQFSDGDEAYMSFHIPHDYVPGTDIYLHIHWSQTSATATGGTLDFKYFAIYAKGWNQVSGSTFTATPKTDTFSSIDINDGDSGLNQYQHHLTEVIISAATATAALLDRDDFEPDGVIELTLEMDANNLTNSGSVLDPFIHYVDLHYQTTGIFGTKSKEPDFYT